MKLKYSDSKDGKVVFDKDGALGRVIHTSDETEYVNLTLQIGAEIAPHVLPFSSTFFIIKGVAELVVDGKVLDVKTYDIVEVPAGSSRGVKNSSDTALELLVIKHF